MKISVASDHAGYEVKEAIKEHLIAAGHEVIDFGTDSTESTDYPDHATPAASFAPSVLSSRSVSGTPRPAQAG